MEKAFSMVAEQESDEATHEEGGRIWRERPCSTEELFYGTDEAGRSGWFLRLSVAGMYPRRIGPYNSQEGALSVVNAVVAEFVLDSMTDILNGLEDGQVCVQEGVPLLAATAGTK